MMKTMTAETKNITYRDENITRFNIEIKGKLYNCINYNKLTGEVEEKDTVLLNITAEELGLGSGGYHFVIANLSGGRYSNIGDGHIMKLRYTPMQMNVMAAEAQESPFHEIFNSFESLEGMPVIVGTLHSMVAPIALSLKHIANKGRIAYIMTDGGALPLWMSETVKRLSGEGILNGTITYGNAFGGDIECINIYTAIISAREILKADAAIVCMGPGIAGTDTRYGFSGTEQSQIIDAVNILKGKAIAVPRISFSDSRNRHYGLSHHSRTNLGRLCFTRSSIALPRLSEEKMELLGTQLMESGIVSKHDISYWSTDKVEKLLDNEVFHLEKMGKDYKEDRDYFNTCGLSAFLAAN